MVVVLPFYYPQNRNTSTFTSTFTSPPPLLLLLIMFQILDPPYLRAKTSPAAQPANRGDTGHRLRSLEVPCVAVCVAVCATNWALQNTVSNYVSP